MSRANLGPAKKRGRALIAIASCGLAAACASADPGVGAAREQPGAERAATAPSATAATTSSVRADGPHAEWSACQRDDECTFVSLGCCSTTPVNRAFSAQAMAALEASGARFCPVKQLCGPGVDGTFAGTPGKCVAGRCGCDPETPLVDNCLGK